MKRLIPLLLCLLLLLTGCVKPPTSFPGSSSPDQSDPPVSSGVPSTGSDTSDPEDPAPSGWQKAYLDVLNGLSEEYGCYFSTQPHLPLTGLTFARLLDFNGDGVREMVTLVDRTVRLYTYRDEAAQLLYEGEVGGRLGQTDVSYLFRLNAQASTPCLILFHSQYEWTEEAITIVTLSGEGQIVTTELYATMPEDIWSQLPDSNPTREHLSSFSLDGKAVSPEVYDSVRTRALNDSIAVEAYVEGQQGTAVVNKTALDKVFYTLAHWGEYILPDADVRVYDREELSQLTARELRLARNEIYARHGRIFQAADLTAHFGEEIWYLPLYTPEEFDAIAPTLLNRYELANISALLAVESSGVHAETTEMLTPEDALAIAEVYWNYHSGKLDPETGFLLSLSAEPLVGTGDRSYYVFRLHVLENNDHWITRELLYVDAQTGLTSTSIPE